MHHSLHFIFVWTLALTTFACGGDSVPETDAGIDMTADAESSDMPLPDPVCIPGGSHWSSGTSIFENVTESSGIATIDAQGIRFSVADIDNDGYADLAVRRGGLAQDVVPPGDTAARYRWLLRNRGDGTFEDVTESSGILAPRQEQAPRTMRASEIWVFGDVDNDGDADVYMGTNTSDRAAIHGETSEVLLNDGHGHFSLGPEDSDVRRATYVDTVAGASFVDFDRDGILDLWVVEFGPGSYTQQSYLYRGDGSGRFTDVTESQGLTTLGWNNLKDIDLGLGHGRSWAALACDLDNNGTPDLLDASYGRAPNLLFTGTRTEDGVVSYKNVSVSSGYAYDDIMTYDDNEFFLCFCDTYHPDDPSCAGVAGHHSVAMCMEAWNPETDPHAFRQGGDSGTTSCADIDGDGDLDLLTSEIKHWWAGVAADASRWLINDGVSPLHFSRPDRDAMGINVPHVTRDWDEGIMTNAVLDFDLDGRLDFYFGNSDYPHTHGLLYHQDGPAHFETVPVTDGIDVHRGHGIAVLDFDHDGKLDVVVGTGNSRCSLPDNTDPCYATQQVRLLRNVMPAGNYIALHLVGGASTNRQAIGARITVVADGRTAVQEVEGGHGQYGYQNDAVLTFGLGASCAADIQIRWPDASLTTQTFVQLGAGHRYRIDQERGVSVE